ncbi:hypothetical protein [Natranaeroarchaeum sulfidigenes]|uniref:Putative membrane protein n=1 Tax=Natranaeroarchaeum sulfidigenes TaxID=2784880 RepID=A0A897MSR0_9EURY|nr:hypothetical protein [Natranaeroarchaeum sulfidigenes]QSG03331.1 putative membrane protein [Natranaeroarchaeum sulfidigenes]
MSQSDSRLQNVPLVQGSVAGLLTWVLGYLFTYLIAGDEVQESEINQFLEFIGEEPATYEMVGWVFYNAHFVDTTFQNVPFFGSEAFIGGEDGFTMLLYVIPPLLLIGAGLAVARYSAAQNANDGAIAGISVVPGYLLLSIAGIFLFEVTLGDASAAPDLVAGVFLAGLVFPVLFGAVGGVLAGVTAE